MDKSPPFVHHPETPKDLDVHTYINRIHIITQSYTLSMYYLHVLYRASQICGKVIIFQIRSVGPLQGVDRGIDQ